MADQTEVKLPESLEVVAWAEKHTMAAIRASASYGEVVLTTEHGPYDIDRPTFKCDRLVEAIVAARDAHWQSSLKARDAEIERLRGVVVETRRVLELENSKGAASAIQDTIWRGSAETLFDYLDASLENGGANV